MILYYRYLGSWPSDEETAYTMTSAAPRSVDKIVWAKLNVQISRTEPKRQELERICPLFLLLQLAAQWSRITLWG